MNKLVDRKDVTVKNMLKLYSNDTRYKKKISWDCFYLVTGWKNVNLTKNIKHG